jgi:four helix bundle protein
MAVKSYKDLTVWNDGIALTVALYTLTDSFPDRERFGLTSQMRRCAVSVPSNIAEGHARLSTREYLKHVSYALGSLAELETQLHLSLQLRYSTAKTSQPLLEDADRLGKQLRNLAKSLRARIASEQKKSPPPRP